MRSLPWPLAIAVVPKHGQGHKVDPKHTNTAKRKIKIANDLPGGGTRAEEVGHRLADAVLLDFSCRTSASYVALFSLRP